MIIRRSSERSRPHLDRWRRRRGTQLPELDLAVFAVDPAGGDEGLILAGEADRLDPAGVPLQVGDQFTQWRRPRA